MDSLEDGKIIPELREVLNQLETENIVTDLPIDPGEFHVENKKTTSGSKYLQDNLREISKEVGFVKNDEEFNEVLQSIQIRKTKQDIKSSVEKDKLMAQAVSALHDLREKSNELSERLKEWYGLYYPELKVDSNQKYAELVARHDEREGFKDFDGSMGMDLDPRDIGIMKEFAGEVKSVFRTLEDLKDYLEDTMHSVAPNITHIIGAEMAAKLISLAGSLEKLAKMPSSKIQLLGAEKALFRHLRGGGKPPKYGIIYNHPYIQKTPEGKRGKVARAIASKLMMAARTDQYTDEFKGEKYKKELEEKIDKIRKD
jgi:nucleolar protein 56